MKRLYLALLLASFFCLPKTVFGTDTPGSSSSSCSFTISIGQIRNYIISVTWTGAGGASGSPVVTGMGQTQTAYMAPGNYVIHAKYLDSNGTAKDPAPLTCGTQIKYSFVGHDGNCAAYNEASVTIIHSNKAQARPSK